jgi:hypothetical protein
LVREPPRRRRPVGGSGYNVEVAEPRDDFPNNYVGDLVPTERGWLVVPFPPNAGGNNFTVNYCPLNDMAGDRYFQLIDHPLKGLLFIHVGDVERINIAHVRTPKLVRLGLRVHANPRS